MFVECLQVKTLWTRLQNWVMRHMGYNLHLSDIEILFGLLLPNSCLVNHLMLLTKHYIYSTRLSGEELVLEHLINLFRDVFKTEMYSKVNMKCDMFSGSGLPSMRNTNLT